MNSYKELTYRGRPSSLYTLWLGLKTGGGKTGTGDKPSIPGIRTCRKSAAINGKHLQAYLETCGISSGPFLPHLYPLMLVYPFNLRIISLKEVPLGMFRMLNTRTVVTAYRPITGNEIFDIVCELSDSRIVKKGVELDIRSVLRNGGDIIWECVKTFYFKGNFGEPDIPVNRKRLGPVPDARAVKSWYLSSGKGWRFAGISGDSNGLHYSRTYARLMGFKRDFAQPMMITGRCLELLDESRSDGATRLDFLYKGQVYYERQLALGYGRDNGSMWFDLYCEGNEKPCICGEVTRL